MVKNNEFLQEAAQSIYMANADEMVRQKCYAREEAERHERTLKRDMDRLKAQLAEATQITALQKQELVAKEQEIKKLHQELARYKK